MSGGVGLYVYLILVISKGRGGYMVYNDGLVGWGEESMGITFGVGWAIFLEQGNVGYDSYISFFYL